MHLGLSYLQDAEVYSLRRCIKARSFLLALVVSFLVIILLLAATVVTAILLG